jgi:hypothetical protein
MMVKLILNDNVYTPKTFRLRKIKNSNFYKLIIFEKCNYILINFDEKQVEVFTLIYYNTLFSDIKNNILRIVYFKYNIEIDLNKKSIYVEETNTQFIVYKTKIDQQGKITNG